jgi:hypothetical protein
MENESSSNLRRRLTGAWTLRSYVETNAETGEVSYPMGTSPKGFILYTPDGYMSAQLCVGVRGKFADNDMFGGTEHEYRLAGQSYLAYSGAFDVDDADSKVFHDMSVSLFPNWAGMRQARIATLSGDTLQLSFERPQLSRGAMRTADLTWTRATPR